MIIGRTILATLFVTSLVGCSQGGPDEDLGEQTQATTPSGISFLPLGRATFDPVDVEFKSDEFVQHPKFKVKLKTDQSFDVATQIVTFQPGGFSGWHSHGGPTIILVKSGTLTEYDGNDPTCSPHTLKTGEGEVEVKDRSHVHMVRNETSAVAELVVTYIMPVGLNPPRVDRPNPGNCAALGF